MTGYRVHFIDRVQRPLAYKAGLTMWIAITVDAKDNDHEVNFFFEDQASFDAAVLTLNAEFKELSA